MPTEATVTLEELSCRTLKDFETSVEPYIWPVLIKIDSSTINAADGRRVDVIAPSDANSLVRIKSGMKAGTSAPIPGSLGTLSARFSNSTSNQQLIVLVQLMERDETPGHAMHKGYRAYVKELRAAFKAEFIHLFEAENDDAELALVVGRIKKRVEGKVTSVIEDSLSVGEKIKVIIYLTHPLFHVSMASP